MKWTLKGSSNWEHRKARGQLKEMNIYINKVIGYHPEMRIANTPKEKRHT